MDGRWEDGGAFVRDLLSIQRRAVVRRVAGLAGGTIPAVEHSVASVGYAPALRSRGVAGLRRAAAVVRDAAAAASHRRRAGTALDDVGAAVVGLSAFGSELRA